MSSAKNKPWHVRALNKRLLSFFIVTSFFSIPSNYLTYLSSVVPPDLPTLGHSKNPPETPYTHSAKFLNDYHKHLSHFLEGPGVKTDLLGSMVPCHANQSLTGLL